jgi:multicomponent Na+:H+ antiporter subunit G
MREFLVLFLLIVGVIFSMIAAVGVLRFPDLYTRLHSASKVGTMGISNIVLAAAIHFNDPGVSVRVILVIAFVLLTAPVAAHMISRAGYKVGVRMTDKSVLDELQKEDQNL